MSLNKSRLEEQFRNEYKKLNPEQQKAVDTIEGPVMVIAGPGTGKTQILASRIGKILLDTDVLPENILCLTYTDAGVIAMRDRVRKFIGPDAYKVHIATFHSFCNEVIQENLSLFEKTALDPVSELEKIAFLKELIDSLPKNHPLKRYRGDVYFEVKNLDSLFSTMKKEGWSPEFIISRIDAYLAELPTRDGYFYKRKYKQFNAGDPKVEKIAEEKERMEKLRAAVQEFDRFQYLMRRKNRYDFEDMINWVIRAFEENKNLLATYQEKYQYILVDEYQDTSGMQNRLVELLISYWDSPNVFVVGDDDQSIFRFQGANVENMLQFANKYQKELLTLVLTSNYRSVQPILDISRSLINRNEERLVKKITGLSKELVADNKAISHLVHPPVILSYENQRQEMIGIAKKVKELVNNKVKPGEIAVIYKEHKYGEELAKYFKALGINTYSKRNLNILEIPLVKKITLLLQYLAAEHDTPYGGDEMLFELLHVDWFGIPPVEIAKLSIEVSEKKYSEGKTSMRQLLYEKSLAPARDLFTTGPHEGLKKASGLIEKLIAAVPNSTLQQLFETCIREAGVLRQVMQSPEKHWELQVLTRLFDFVKEETHRNPLMNLQELVSLLEMMEKEGVSLPMVQVNGNDKGVNLLTVHGSKGLEFEYVFLAGSNAGFWESKKKPAGGYKFPDNLFTSNTDDGNHNDKEELRRLFYVAITRAKHWLYISYSQFKNDGKEMEPSMFIAEIQDEHEIKTQPATIDNDTLDEFAALSFAQPEAPEIEKMEDAVIGRVLDKFVMNVTALNHYLNCPLEFYFRNLIRIPSPKNEATEFGSAVHYALEQLFRRMMGTQEGDGASKRAKTAFPSKEIFIQDFEWYMHRHRESFTKEQFDRRMEYGQEVLSNYYDKYIDSFNTIVSIERSIRNVVVSGVPLKGKLDKLEFDGKLVNVVDYKTGDPDKAKFKLEGPNDKYPGGGDYWRQAVFYKILVDHYEQRGWKAISTEFDFIEPDRKKQYRKAKITITPQDIETVTNQITTTWQKIQNREFYTGCGKEDCHWCQFVKTNNLAVALHAVEEEAED